MDAGSEGYNYEYSHSEAGSVQSMEGDYSFEADAQPLVSQVMPSLAAAELPWQVLLMVG